MPPAIQQSNPKHYKSDTVTEIREYEGYAHLLPAQEGWERSPTTCSTGRVEHARPCERGTDPSPTSAGRPCWSRSAGWRLLTDPTFDPPGGHYEFGWGTSSRQARRARRSPPSDLAADRRGAAHPRPPRRQPRRRRPGAAARGRHGAHHGQPAPGGSAAAPRGLAPWATTRLEATAGRPIEVTATPCRHGPPLSRPDRRRRRRLRAALGRPAARCALDHRRHRAVRRRPRRSPTACDVGIALVHLGGVRFPVTGPLRYTMTGRDAVELCELRPAASRRPGALRGLAALPAAPEGRRARVRRRARRHPAQRPVAGHRRAPRHHRLNHASATPGMSAATASPGSGEVTARTSHPDRSRPRTIRTGTSDGLGYGRARGEHRLVGRRTAATLDRRGRDRARDACTTCTGRSSTPWP